MTEDVYGWISLQRNDTKDKRIAELEAALSWYAEQAEGCRKIGSAGDPARHALDHDGGAKARAALLNPHC